MPNPPTLACGCSAWMGECFVQGAIYFLVRVLTLLKRGGIRGIVQLAILREIEREFEGHMRIQWFFDLVVGTRWVVDEKISIAVQEF